MTIEEIRKGAPKRRRSYGFTKEKAARISLNTQSAYLSIRNNATPYAVAYRFNNGAVEYLTGNPCLDGSVCAGYVAGEWIEL